MPVPRLLLNFTLLGVSRPVFQFYLVSAQSCWFVFFLFQMPPTRNKRGRPARQSRRPQRYASPTPEQPSTPISQSRPDPPASPLCTPAVGSAPVAPGAAIDQETLTALRSEVTNSVLTNLANWGILPIPQPAPSTGPVESSPPTAVTSITQLNAGQSPITFQPEALDLPSFQPVSFPLGATLPAKTKAKIWAGEFVDLTTLTSAPSEPPLSITVAKGKSQQTVSRSGFP